MPLPKKIEDLIPLLGLVPHPEGGFFAETFRSGCAPMTTLGQTGFGCEDEQRDLVITRGRESNREDGDARRNAMTSIFWAPSLRYPKVLLATNCSDHVHYYHGGRPFRYFLYDPVAREYSEHVLGPELHRGHKLQLAVRGGVWKCGTMVVDDGEDDDHDYSLIGEGVGPGWDAADFEFVTEKMVREAFADDRDETARNRLLSLLHRQSTELRTEQKTTEFMRDEITKSVQEAAVDQSGPRR